MEITVEKLFEVVTILRVSGKVDTYTAPELEKAVSQAMAAPRSGCVLNLAAVDYMSSAGLRVLVMGAKSAAGNAGAFVVCTLQDEVRRILEMVGFLPLIEIVADETASLEAVRARLGT